MAVAITSGAAIFKLNEDADPDQDKGSTTELIGIVLIVCCTGSTLTLPLTPTLSSTPNPDPNPGLVRALALRLPPALTLTPALRPTPALTPSSILTRCATWVPTRSHPTGSRRSSSSTASHPW
jgi:hypothetical protein